MKLRTVAFAAVVVGATLAPAAEAAVKPVCNLLVDDKGDASPVNDASLDVVSADIASDARKLTAAIRLSGSPTALVPTAPTGRTYHIEFVGQGGANPVFMTYIVTPTTSAGTYGYFDPATQVNTGIAEATVKVVGNTIYLTAPTGAFAPYGKFKPGSKITNIRVVIGRMVGAYANSGAYAYNTLTADTGDGAKPYVAGTKSCVKVGG